jgi:hypothetical protein
VLATLSTTRTSDLRAAGSGRDAALVGGYHLAFGIAALLVLAALGVALVVLRRAGAAETEEAPAAAPAYADD